MARQHRHDRPHAPRRRPSGRGSAGVALAALTALALTLPGLAAPRAAAAGPALGECGAGQLCFWEGAGFQGARQVYELARAVGDRFPELELGLHFHNTRGAALANVLAGLEAGVTVFDGAVRGLGGCPYAPGATGNLATEDLVDMLEAMGIATGIDLEALLDCARLAERHDGRQLPSHVLRAGKRPA